MRYSEHKSKRGSGKPAINGKGVAKVVKGRVSYEDDWAAKEWCAEKDQSQPNLDSEIDERESPAPKEAAVDPTDFNMNDWPSLEESTSAASHVRRQRTSTLAAMSLSAVRCGQRVAAPCPTQEVTEDIDARSECSDFSMCGDFIVKASRSECSEFGFLDTDTDSCSVAGSEWEVVDADLFLPFSSQVSDIPDSDSDNMQADADTTATADTDQPAKQEISMADLLDRCVPRRPNMPEITPKREQLLTCIDETGVLESTRGDAELHKTILSLTAGQGVSMPLRRGHRESASLSLQEANERRWQRQVTADGGKRMDFKERQRREASITGRELQREAQLGRDRDFILEQLAARWEIGQHITSRSEWDRFIQASWDAIPTRKSRQGYLYYRTWSGRNCDSFLPQFIQTVLEEAHHEVVNSDPRSRPHIDIRSRALEIASGNCNYYGIHTHKYGKAGWATTWVGKTMSAPS